MSNSEMTQPITTLNNNNPINSHLIAGFVAKTDDRRHDAHPAEHD
jgi:hypothetical protein